MYNNQNNQQAVQSIRQARGIVNQLRQAEQKNAMNARQLSDMEAGNELTLRQGNLNNPQSMAQKEGQAANQLQNFANAEQNATRQLDQLNQLLSQIENQLQ